MSEEAGKRSSSHADGNSSGFGRVEELFHRAADLPPEQRHVLLAPLAAEDPELLARLQRMLEAADEDAALPGMDIESSVDPQTDTSESERIWGNFRLLRRVGSGGMGVVWQAEQLQPIQRLVAIKVVPSGLDSERVIARFELERQTIAAMAHPNIAQVFEAGETPDGRPFFVMEFVEGEAITEFCDEHELDIAARIDLLLAVCDGVAHAHQRGVIHRDLKPSNVLVSRDPATQKLIAKIIDFGISKATHGDGTDSNLTRMGEVIGTPQYMSPEQSAGSQVPVDVRSDVYSLGVILYELLTGDTPRRSGSAGTADRATTWIQPSHLSLPPDDATRIATHRRTQPRVLRRLLRGDLEWVVLKALEQEPARRYPSVATFAADLRRFLDRRPVSAGPPSRIYRLRRFIARNRLLSAAAALIVLSIAAAVIGTTAGMVRARTAEAEALALAEEARDQALRAERSKQFLVDLFKSQNPVKRDGRDLTVAEVFEEGLQRVEEELSDQPGLQAELFATIGAVYTEVARYDEAEEVLRRSVEMLEDLDGFVKERAVARIDLGKLYWRLDRIDDAIAQFERALAILDPNEHPVQIGSALNAYSNAVASRDPTKSRELLKRALDVLRRDGESHPEQESALLANIGTSYARSGDYEEAAQRLEEALPLLVESQGEDDPRVGVLLGNLAFTYRRLEQYPRAHALMQRDVEHTRRLLGDEHPSLGTALFNLSIVQVHLGAWDDAVSTAEQSRRVLQSKLDSGHRMLHLSAKQLARALSARGAPGDGERAAALLSPFVRELERDFEGLDEPSKRRWVDSNNALSIIFRRNGDAAEALRHGQTALRHSEEEGREHLEIEARWAIAAAHALRGDEAAAHENRVAAERLARDLEAGEAQILHHRALIAALLGDDASAIESLIAAAEGGSRILLPLVDPAFASARTDARFVAIADRIRENIGASPDRSNGGNNSADSL